MELVEGAILGVVFEQFRKEIWRVKDNVVMFKPKLEELEETLATLFPMIEEIEELNRRLNRPNHGRETIVLKRLLEDGTKLVSKCSKIPIWNLHKRSRYREKLRALHNEIVRFNSLYMPALMAKDQRETLLFVQDTRQMLTETKEMLLMLLNQQGSSSNPTLSSMLLNQQGSSSNPTWSSMLLNPTRVFIKYYYELHHFIRRFFLPI